jgi:transposase
MEISDYQWDLLKDLLDETTKRAEKRGRSRKDIPRILNGILWILRIGAQWADLPRRYPP